MITEVGIKLKTSEFKIINYKTSSAEKSSILFLESSWNKKVTKSFGYSLRTFGTYSLEIDFLIG